MSNETQIKEIDQSRYDFKNSEKVITFKSSPGLSRDLVIQISKMKGEPEWMLEHRLKCFDIFMNKPLPKWGPDLSEINFDEMHYYIVPGEKKATDWNEVPDEIKETFEKIGVPEMERKVLAGSIAQYESTGVYQHLKERYRKMGIIFCDMDTALKEHEELVKKYFMKCIPGTDNKFAALHGAFWSGGSFVYVPKGVKCDLPLQTYFRMNAAQEGQFEHTLIIAEEGSEVHYIEGCFTAGALVRTESGFKKIEDVKVGEKVLTHTGQFKEVYYTQERPYSGDIVTLNIRGNTLESINATDEHPFLIVKRQYSRERNRKWETHWVPAKDIKKNDYVAIPINKNMVENESVEFTAQVANKGGQLMLLKRSVPCTKELFSLIGYYLSEGSIDASQHYLNFAFHLNENEYVEEVKSHLTKLFGVNNFYTPIDEEKNGTSIVVSNSELSRIFSQFGTLCDNKSIPQWAMLESPEKQKELIRALWNGDGNYGNKNYKWGRKEMFRINTTSETLARQVREILFRLGIVSSINLRIRESPGRPMYVVVIGGEFLEKFGEIVGIKVDNRLNGKKRATYYHITDEYIFAPVNDISINKVENVPVYNFSVENDESYTVEYCAVHNCTAPKYSKASLHAAIVEIFVKENAKVRYSTVQNWSKNVYNLNTKRAIVEKNGKMEWVGGSLGSKITMLYPCTVLRGEGSTASHLNIAFGTADTWKDGGAKVIHAAPNTSSKVIAKSISMGGGVSVYRGLLRINKGATNAKSHVQCDALIMDPTSHSYTYPHNEIYEPSATLAHEASVGKISEEQLFYMMSRGLTENEARSMIVLGFLDDVLKEIPLEFSVELNRLVQLEMSKLGAVG